jgi:hypothetical protein
LSWIGFEAKGGGAQVFLQSPAAFDVAQRLDGTTLTVSLDLRRLGTNTWRHVDTRFFDNPLAGIAARQARPRKGKRAIEVKIKFKNPKDVREGVLRSATEADGLYYVYLTFPEGTDAGKPVTIDEPEQ